MEAVESSAQQAHLFIVMGVSGCGKSTVAQALADAFSMQFIEADDYHSMLAKAQMAAGIPLTDDIRDEWITRLTETVNNASVRSPLLVLACSALRKQHRDRLRTSGVPVTFIYLKGEKQLIAERLAKRSEHFFAPSLLDSQFSDLQPPTPQEPVLTVNIDRGFELVLRDAQAAVKKVLEHA